MINSEEVFYIGKITKSRGINGEVELLFTDDSFDYGSADYLVLDREGILVPFFWEEYRFKNQETAIFKFEDFNDENEVKEIVGAKVYYPKCCIEEEECNDLKSYKSLTGFSLYETKHGLIGEVVEVNDSSVNILLIIKTTNGEEILIPYHDDLLESFDIKSRTLTLNLPEGLLEIN